MKVRAALLFLPLASAMALAACGERAPENEGRQGSTTPPYVREQADPSLLGNALVPVRIGEAGPSFAACTARGTTRDRAGGGPVAVRGAPFDRANEVDRLAPGAEFFICARTHDQRWFGIVYAVGGEGAERCGVAAPASARRDYDGPCASGWVVSARVRLVSGMPHQLPPQPVPEG